MYMTEDVPGLGHRPSYWPRGKVLGVSSSINAMVYIRGNARDYDNWAAAGNPGWGYADVLPYFIRSETHPGGAGPYHGGSGPLHVADVSREANPLCRNFLEAGEQEGMLCTTDFKNGRAS